MKNCGSCINFIKIERIIGLCSLLDCRAKTDSGTKCKSYKRMKFHKMEEIIKLERDKCG